MNATIIQPETILSQSEVSRRVNATEKQLRQAIRSGSIVPDFVLGRVFHAFRPSRLPQISEALKKARKRNSISSTATPANS